MRYLAILENGVVWPSIRKSDNIISIIDGVVRVGKYNKVNYLNNKFYLDCPINEEELINEVIDRIKVTNRNLFNIKGLHVHFVCPKEINSKFIWATKLKEIVKVI